MKGKLKKLCQKVKDYVIQIYQDKVCQVILYGSQAKDTTTHESDVDLLIVVDESLDPFSVREQLSDLLWDIFMDEGELISVVVLPEKFYANYKSAFILNVKKEGIAI
ncbi:MAG: nucleotidyltransferase domain-containing protein [Candidatus Heimdallarchaeota archaeon]